MKKTVTALFKKATAFICITLILISALNTGLVSLAADDFDNQLAAFPESYRIYLRQLHEKYPDWKFEALETGLVWETAVKEESSKNRSLVPKNASYYLKSRKSGDYIPETDTYIEKDVGWVSATSVAVAHFMDPRNFLNESDIFQFELLSFSNTITVETVEKVLEDTFMQNSAISYYDAEGNYFTLEKTYAEAIYDAGKEYNINPCYLASKIRNEIVISSGEGSSSVSGKYEGFEGIYNFYNIGASDGENPIKNGLEWASNNDAAYGRPWTDPEKSINGGALWIAEKYIAKGQDTGYLQRFNVAPDSEYPVYTHQYMTNVSGADSQGYSTYLSYKDLDLLSLERVFSIPVYENMPGESAQSLDVMIEDIGSMSAVVNYSAVNVRSTPSTYGEIVVRLTRGTRVEILDSGRVESLYYGHFLNNPFWCRISAEVNGITYTGYMSCDYLDFVPSATVIAGSSLQTSVLTDTGEAPSYFSFDESIATVDKNGAVTAKKCGTTQIFATTSGGGFDSFVVQVDHCFSYWKSLKVPSCAETGQDIRCCLYCDYTETRTIPVTQAHKSLVKIKAVAPTYTKTGLTEGVRCADCGKITVLQKTVAKLTLDKVEGLKAKKIKVAKSSEITLTWNKVDDGVKYEIYRYTGGKWKKIKTTSKTSYTVKKLKADKSYKFRVRAVVDGAVPGKFSTSLKVETIPESTKLKLNAGKKQLTASWSKVSDISGYDLQYSTSKKFSKKATKKINLKKSSKKTTIKKLSKNKKYYVKIRAYKTVNGKKIYSDWSKVKNVKVK